MSPTDSQLGRFLSIYNAVSGDRPITFRHVSFVPISKKSLVINYVRVKFGVL